MSLKIEDHSDLNAELLKIHVQVRTGLKAGELVCPREKSAMTPCAVRDGKTAISENGKECISCNGVVFKLLQEEVKKI